VQPAAACFASPRPGPAPSMLTGRAEARALTDSWRSSTGPARPGPARPWPTEASPPHQVSNIYLKPRGMSCAHRKMMMASF
jgi:hypothetical protein